jgi:hypothetical protein
MAAALENPRKISDRVAMVKGYGGRRRPTRVLESLQAAVMEFDAQAAEVEGVFVRAVPLAADISDLVCQIARGASSGDRGITSVAARRLGFGGGKLHRLAPAVLAQSWVLAQDGRESAWLCRPHSWRIETGGRWSCCCWPSPDRRKRDN